jgi:hypothetical protein
MSNLYSNAQQANNPYKKQKSQNVQFVSTSSPSTQNKPSTTPVISPATTSLYSSFKTRAADCTDQSRCTSTAPVESEIVNKSISNSSTNEYNNTHNDNRGGKYPSPPVGDRPLKSILCETKYSGPYQPTLTQLRRQIQHDNKQVTTNKDVVTNEDVACLLTLCSQVDITPMKKSDSAPTHTEESERSESPLTSYITGSKKDTQFLADSISNL